MATWGSLNNTNTENSTSGRKFSSGTFATPGGSITDLHVYIAGWAGAESSRWAIYSGGSAGDPTGATLVCDFGEVTTNISATPAWYGMVANFGKTASGTISSGALVWIMCKLADCYVYLTNTDKGDLNTGCEEFTVESSSPSVAFPSTWPTDAGTGSAEALKAYITYSGGAAPSPDTGTITSTGYAPTVSVVSGPVAIPIDVGAITATTYAPSLPSGGNKQFDVSTGSQVISTYAESVGIGFGVPEGTGPEAAFPDDTNVGITGYTVSVGGDYAIGIGVGSVSISTYDLTVSSTQGTFIPVDVGAITTTGYAPVDVSSHVPSPGTATQTITGYIPLIGTSHFRTPDVVEITITGYDVSTAPTTDIYIDVGSGEITSASSALSLIRGIGRAPGTATLGFTGYTPFALTEDVSWEFFPDEGSATYSTYDLTLSIIEVNKSIPIAVGSLVIPGWKPPFGSNPSVEVGARKRRKILGFLK